MDQLRARAFLDFTLGVSSFPLVSPDTSSGPGPDGAGPDSPATGAPAAGDTGPGHSGGDPRAGNAGNGGGSNAGHGGNGGTGGAGNGDPCPAASSPGAPGASTASPAPGSRAATPPAPPSTGPAARINLTIPLATLLGLAERPGDAHGLGPIDPALARTLAGAAATNPHTTWCVTVTDQDGHPTAHGCARTARPASSRGGAAGPATGGGNRDGPAFIQDDHGPPGPGGHGRWRLTTPGPAGRDYTLNIGPLAVTDCDHRGESAGYQPSDRLRHLVETRDGECTWPPCRRHAPACDFEHAVPYDQGGRTCACNAGARCRHHHRAKQSPGWRLDQHQPGYHTWTTPSGRTYTTGATQYPT